MDIYWLIKYTQSTILGTKIDEVFTTKSYVLSTQFIFTLEVISRLPI